MTQNVVLEQRETEIRLEKLIEGVKDGSLNIQNYSVNASDMRAEHTFTVAAATLTGGSGGAQFGSESQAWTFVPVRLNYLDEAEKLAQDIQHGHLGLRGGLLNDSELGFRFVVEVTDSSSAGYGAYQKGGIPRS